MTRGLVVARYLYESGVQQSHQSGFRRATALLTLHDAVEMLLVLGLQHHGLYKRKKLYAFDEYWTELATKQVYVTQQGAMERLTNLRVSLKHHASLPGPDVVAEARTLTRSFFVDNTPIIFGVNFEDIALSSLVTASDEARAHLVNAERHMTDVKYDDAIGEIAYALHRLLNDHEARLRESRWARGGKRALRLDAVFLPPSLSGTMNVFGGFPTKSEGGDLSRFAQDVSDRIRELQQGVGVLGLGLDFERWQRFMRLTPTVLELQPGQLNRTGWHGDTPPTLDECRFCYDFVIDSALRLQESEM
jgi:hypothetical protein